MSGKFDPEKAENLEDMEKQFAVKAVEHLMTYWGILEKVPGSKLRLTKMDDEIYENFKQEFPDFDPAATLNEDEMKSKLGKEKWRNWMNQYEKTIHDYNFGTIIRTSPKYEYDHDTTIFEITGPQRIMDRKASYTKRRRCQRWNAGWTALFSFTDKKQTLTLILATAFAVLAGLVMPAFAFILGDLFNSFMLCGAGGISSQTLLDQVITGCVKLAYLGLASWLLNGCYFLLFIVFGEQQAASARKDVFQSLLEKNIEWFEGRGDGTAAFLSCVQAQIHDLQMATSQPLGIVMQYSFRTLISLALALYTSWDLSLVTLAGIPVFSAMVAFLSTRMKPSIEAQQSELSSATKVGSSAITSISTVKCFNGQNDERHKFSLRIDRAALHYLKHARINALQISTIRLMMFGMFVQGFWYGSHLVSLGKLSAGETLRAFWLCLIAAQSIELGLPQAIVLEKGKVAANALTNVLERETATLDKNNQSAYPWYCDGDIEITFAYANQPERPVLKSASFSFPAGETTFVIGKSGSGKSTLGQLLMRFYLPTSGKIKIDGRSTESLSINWIRNNMTLVEQRSVLFNESMLANIAFGRRDYEPIDKSDIQDSIELAMLQSTVDSLPHGVNTCVGSGGGFLSGGQRQRVAIARAKLRDTPILILDEPTSSLDSANRVAVTKAIREWRKDKTTIIITHDMTQIEEDDFVYVLDQGGVVQSGSRSELEREKGFPFGKTSCPGVRDIACNGAESDGISDIPDNCSNDTLLDESVPSLKAPAPSYTRDHHNQHEIQLRDLGRTHTYRHSVLTDLQDRRLSVAPFRHHVDLTARRQSMPEASRRPIRNRAPQQKHLTSTYEIMKTIIPSLTGKQRLLLALGFICTVAHASATPLFAFCMSQLFGTFYEQKASVMRWSLAVLGVAIGDATVSFFMHYYLEYCGEAWVTCLRKQAFQRVLDQPLQWFEKETNSPARLVASLDQNGEDMCDLVGRFAGFVLVAATTTVVAVIWSLASCWKLTFVALACGPVIYAITRGFDTASVLWEKSSNEASRVAGEVLVETFSEVRTVRALTLEAYFHGKHIRACSNCLALGVKRAGYTGVMFGLAESTIVFVSALIFYYGSVLVASSEFTVKNIITTFSMLLFSIGYAGTVLSWIPQIGTSRDMAAQLLRLANLPEGMSHEHKGDLVVSRTTPVTVTGLNFRYPSRPDALALQDVSFTIPNHSCIAFVGRSGSGKSTIASLLTALYESPLSHGGCPAISLAGVDIRRLHTPTLRSLVSIVSQQPTIFPGTILENISHGLDDTSPLRSMSNITAAAHSAGIDDFIDSLPSGYQTVIGDGGVGLSGGQAQRLVIARALVRRPQILILDEATSSLDRTSAELIRQTIVRLTRTSPAALTVLLITHASEMMEIADRVVVLEHGRVVEQGAYRDLMGRLGGKLRSLVQESL